MRPLPLLTATLLLCAGAARAADREFTDVVRFISDEFHTRPTSIPFFGLVNVFTAAVHPGGASHIDVAVFENLNMRDREGRDLRESILNAVGRAWRPFVQVQSHHGGHEETVLVYLRQQNGKNWKLLVTAIEPEQATVVQLQLNADALARWMLAPEHCARHWSGDITE
jgi:hypothetical protein